ncbi:MAG: LysM peptidoglycan-binding domain-containing protein [Thermoleophilia bacterium]
MSRAIGRVIAPIAALGLVVLLVSLLASSDVLPRAPRPAAATPATTTATTIIEFQQPASDTETTLPSDGSGDPATEGGIAGEGDAGASGDGASSRSSSTTQTASEQTYTVLDGDSPYSIAQRFGVSTQELMEVNEIADPTDLRVGTVLRIPVKQGGQ